MKTAVLIPCYNEELTIKKVILDFKKTLPKADIYVYDNNSTDNSYEIAKDTGAIVKREYRQGKGNVVRSMFRDIDADCYILVDGDDTYPAEASKEIEELILSKKADMVIGDRLSSTYFEENKRRFHNSGNKLVRKLINTIFNSDISDIMTGMRGFSYEFVKSFPISSKEFEIETEMTIFALNHNFLIKELPIEYRDRMDGSESKLNTFSDGYKVISLLFGLFRDIRPLFFFSLVTLVLLIIAGLYFFPILIDFYRTGFVEKVPTLITVGVVAIVAVIIFFTGVVLHVIRKQHDENFEHHLNLIAQNKKR
ncbi:glycosyltransferase family 2 protein [Methanobrevibacter smithii]|uniref:glycosyltransferase family 2 protein n=1 Tax=Methanobrevibacter smithii TaxID=2173 RepID=UPI0037DD91D6